MEKEEQAGAYLSFQGKAVAKETKISLDTGFITFHREYKSGPR